MYNKILVANRGEIALRIIRACRELNIGTVAVYSKADELSLHTKFADEAICVGPAESSKSYLNIPALIAAAELTNADAIHPGYGFLAESSQFSKICDENGIEFIGPPPETIDAMGDKANAKDSMRKIGVPVIYGSDGIVESIEDAKIEAEKAGGYPVMLKATAGGGGKGMRLVESEEHLESAFNTAQSEAEMSFNNGDLYLEKFIQKPRHIEVQILADKHGNVVALGERECSIQRRHQKLIEESPSPGVDEITRNKMYDAAIAGAKASNYVGAGTIEFLMDANNDFFFMEMNTRIQVEHPVTEMVIGADLIKYQILCHAGYPIPDWMKTMKIRGHAIECRINAEDPSHKFRPCPGTISSFHMPGGMGIRVDTHVYAGYTVPPNYDSMVAKLIVHAPSRIEAINRMIGALDECVFEGIKTIIPFQRQILENTDFQKGLIDTGFLENFQFKPGE
ncbi:MAG TPA: acetyl-CoA carboxylase biotin carboxylase subunit [Candidatus Marinimicrobia bacterium]|jgi:acetyl-CoA carboxylase biotin carboxylase subunit|nr:acetyl-CoA carboxylase biotin carboxylase subunit [Candidatus Neomarinimicrobiota bacterium]HJM84648.1 acetyl-CoA carboxylase biotin carboxylase subunit [Candidatus Neomarinimicrobiota bacterium]